MRLRKIKLVYQVIKWSQAQASLDRKNFNCQTDKGFRKRDYRHNLSMGKSWHRQHHSQFTNRPTKSLISPIQAAIYKIALNSRIRRLKLLHVKWRRPLVSSWRDNDSAKKVLAMFLRHQIKLRCKVMNNLSHQLPFMKGMLLLLAVADSATPRYRLSWLNLPQHNSPHQLQPCQNLRKMQRLHLSMTKPTDRRQLSNQMNHSPMRSILKSSKGRTCWRVAYWWTSSTLLSGKKASASASRVSRTKLWSHISMQIRFGTIQRK